MPNPQANLSALPPELKQHIVDYIDDEETLGRLGATNKGWHALIGPRLHPDALKYTSLETLIKSKQRHALARRLIELDDRIEKLLPFRFHDDYAANRFSDQLEDGMSLVTHAATTGDGPMLRFVLRRAGTDFNAPDIIGLRPADWADLTGHTAIWHDAVQSARPYEALILRRVPHRGVLAPSLHQAMKRGHWKLAETLLAPHFERVADGTLMHSPGVTQGQPQAGCNLTPLDCARAHAPYGQGFDELVGRYTPGWPLLPQPLADAAAKACCHGDGWPEALAALVAQGFDLHASPRSGPSYLRRWLRHNVCTLDNVTKLHTICGGVLAPTPTGLAIFQACLWHYDFKKHDLDVRTPPLPLTVALLDAGVLPDPNIDETARILAVRHGICSKLWASLKRLGADLHACDDKGRTLAHIVCRHPDQQVRIDSLFYLQKQGLDIQAHCTAGENPILNIIIHNPYTETTTLELLHGAGIALDRPGNIRRWSSAPVFAAHTALEAVLATSRKIEAAWLLDADLLCTPKQMADAIKRLDAYDTHWPRAWFKPRLRARRLGMRGFYLAGTNPAGAWHTQLSQTRLSTALATHVQSPPAPDASASSHFWHTVRTSALKGACASRRIAAPLTKTTDFVLGTQRDKDAEAETGPMFRYVRRGYRPDTEKHASGVVGYGLAVTGYAVAWPLVYVPAVALSLPARAVARRRTDLSAWDGLARREGMRRTILYYGLDQPILRPLAQSAAALGCVPKALFSGAGYCAGAMAGVAKGATQHRNRARTQKGDARENNA